MNSPIRKLVFTLSALFLLQLTLSAQTFKIIGLGTEGYGTIFSVLPDGSEYEVLHAFSGSDGETPNGKLVELNGKLWGTTQKGGTDDLGTVFRINKDGTGFEHVDSFKEYGTLPKCGLTVYGDELYGVSSTSPYDYSTIFKIDLENDLLEHKKYSSPEQGESNSRELVVSNDLLWGVAFRGGNEPGTNTIDNQGTLFNYDPATNNINLIHDFDGYQASDGRSPNASLVNYGEYLYGSTRHGSIDNFTTYGTIFRVKNDGTDYEVLQQFNGIDGISPVGAMTVFDDQLYGMTSGKGDHNWGTVFRFDPTDNGLEAIYHFTSTNGRPNGPLVLKDGLLWGFTFYGGANGFGILFSIDPTNGDFTTVLDLTAANGGATVPGTVTIVDLEPTTLTIDDIADKTYSDEPFNLTAQTNSSETITFESSDENILSISGATATILGAGNVDITAKVAFDGTYARQSATLNLSISKAELIVSSDDYMIALGDPIPEIYFNYEGFAIGDGIYDLSEPPSPFVAGLPIACACEYAIEMTGGSDQNYTFSKPEYSAILVSPGNQFIYGFGEPGEVLITQGTYELGAASSVGLPISYEISDASVGTIDGGTLTFLKTGSATITASQEGTDDYNAATPVERTITIIKEDQSLENYYLIETFYASTPYALPFTASSDLPLTFASSDEDIAIIQNNTIVPLKSGEFDLIITQDGNEFYNALDPNPVEQTITITKANQFLMNIPIPAPILYVNTPYELTISSSSGLPLTFASSDESIATIQDGEIFPLKNGQFELIISQAGNDIYEALTTVNELFFVNPEITCDIDFSYSVADDGLTVSLSGLGIPGNYSWDFGDGGSSTEEPATHVFSNYGDHEVVLTYTNFDEDCTDIATRTINLCPTFYIDEDIDGFEGDFSVRIPEGFTVDADDSFVWDFGDGSDEVSGQSVSHSFPNQEGYEATVTLTYSINGDVCSNSTSSFFNLTEFGCLGFDNPAASKISTYEYSFSPSPGNQNSTYTWDFGDGHTSTEAEPTHTYSELGLYVITMTETNFVGQTCTNTTDVYVQEDVVSGCTPEITFSYTGLAVHFEPDYTFPSGNYEWSIDGQTFTTAAVDYTFPRVGGYEIAVSGDIDGCDFEKETQIIVSESGIYHIYEAPLPRGILCGATLDITYPDDTENGIRIAINEPDIALISPYVSIQINSAIDPDFSLFISELPYEGTLSPGSYFLSGGFYSGDQICEVSFSENIDMGDISECAFKLSPIEYLSNTAISINALPLNMDIHEMSFSYRLANGERIGDGSEAFSVSNLSWDFPNDKAHTVIVTGTNGACEYEQRVTFHTKDDNPCFFSYDIEETGANTYAFSASAEIAGTFEWSFGETTMSDEIVSHTYAEDVEHSEMVTYTNDQDCFNREYLNFNDPYEDCASPVISMEQVGNRVYLSASLEELDEGITRYYWSLGGNNYAQGATASHVFAETGVYYIGLFYFTAEGEEFVPLCYGADGINVTIDEITTPTHQLDINLYESSQASPFSLALIFDLNGSSVYPIIEQFGEGPLTVDLPAGEYKVLGYSLNYFSEEIDQYVPTYYGDVAEAASAQTLTLTGDQSIDINLAEMSASGDSWDSGSDVLTGAVVADNNAAPSENGRVLNIPQEPAGDVAVKLYDDQGQLLTVTSTNDYGEYEFEKLAAGTYKIVIEHPYAQNITSKTITIDGESTTSEVRIAKGVLSRSGATKTVQTISVVPIPDMLVTDKPFDLNVTSTSGLTDFEYTISGPATISEGLVTLTGETGTVNITVKQSGDATYQEASTTISFDVSANNEILAVSTIDDTWQLVPNPATDHLSIKGLNHQTIKQVVIMTVSGVPVEIYTDTQRFDIRNLSTGIYLVQVQTVNGSYLKRLIKR
ncbi:PKD domain-containing protein [Reichenbachiella carrageenanivorans]|uniref:PKD domain-containing protein n=1 Tax=Reichenbachiella carrageenanivorans TaxID=2979869 RepID=A0ABY6CZ35_9BACT|nr:choice-of-anchor tandem repeat GloVer-containing protein [Reichenbachiella carrageenanivorans]UXX78645.1 PKD domain-containing protein [Reichenbachiella carrageenanivorans]